MINRIPITVLTPAKMIQLGMSEEEIEEYLQYITIKEPEIVIDVAPKEKEVEEVVIIPQIKKERKQYTYTKKKSERKRKFYFPEHWDESIINKWRHYYYRSLKKQMKFSLSHEEFENLLFKNGCRYCGDNDNMTIDRIDSSKGYTSYNTQSCCNTCNILKYYLSEKVFLKQVNKIYQYLHSE